MQLKSILVLLVAFFSVAIAKAQILDVQNTTCNELEYWVRLADVSNPCQPTAVVGSFNVAANSPQYHPINMGMAIYSVTFMDPNLIPLLPTTILSSDCGGSPGITVGVCNDIVYYLNGTYPKYELIFHP